MAAVMVDTAGAVVEVGCWLLAWDEVVGLRGYAGVAMGVVDAAVGALDDDAAVVGADVGANDDYNRVDHDDADVDVEDY